MTKAAGPLARAAQDTRAIAAILNGATLAMAAAEAGYSERTLRRRRDSDPAFQAALAAANAEALDRVRYSVTTAAMTALDTLREAMTNADGEVPWPSRVTAAKTVLELTVGKWITVTGPDGGPVEITAVTPVDTLIDKLERLEAPPIEATASESSEDSEP